MKKFLILCVVFLFAQSSWGALADITLAGDGFQMALGDDWAILDAGTQASLAQLGAASAPSGVSMASKDDGAALCAYRQPSQGMNIQFMALFQSEYVRRIEEALAPAKEYLDSVAQTLCGANNVYCLSFTTVNTPISIYYYFSEESVVTVIFTQAEAEEMTQILSTLSVQAATPPAQP